MAGLTPTELPLFRRFPRLGRSLPHLSLTHLPTPVRPLARTSRELGADLWLKDDGRSSSLYGGNKPRKLEFLLAEARARAFRSVLTFGGLGTHHGLATALFARQLGLQTHLLLVPQPVTAEVQLNLRRLAATGATLHLAPSLPHAIPRALAVMAGGAWHHDRPCLIPTGGSSVVGSLGTVNAGLELAEQVATGDLPKPDRIFVALGSGGTVAGLVLGLRIAGLGSQVVPVLVSDILPPGPRRLAHLARRIRSLLARHSDVELPDVSAADFPVERAFLGSGYGHSTEEARRAKARFAEWESIPLETTYTAKTAAAFLDEAAGAGKECLLFWNTFNSVDLTEALGPLPEPDELPGPFRRFFPGQGPSRKRATDTHRG